MPLEAGGSSLSGLVSDFNLDVWDCNSLKVRVSNAGSIVFSQVRFSSELTDWLRFPPAAGSPKKLTSRLGQATKAQNSDEPDVNHLHFVHVSYCRRPLETTARPAVRGCKEYYDTI